MIIFQMRRAKQYKYTETVCHIYILTEKNPRLPLNKVKKTVGPQRLPTYVHDLGPIEFARSN